jgi:hypothetical protein
MFTECCGTFCIAAGRLVALFHVGKRSNRCFVGQKTDVHIKCYEMAFLGVKVMLQPLHFPQYDVNIGRRRRRNRMAVTNQKIKYPTGTT